MLCTGEQQGIFAGVFRHSFSWSLESNKAFLQGSVDIPSAGAWKNRGMCPCFFCWLLVKKLISQTALLGVVICANENWVALLFQASLVLCSVKCKGWSFRTILVWHLGPRARAPCEGVVSTLFGCTRARGPGAIKPHNEKLADHFQQTQMTSDKKPDYWLSSPPHRLSVCQCKTMQNTNLEWLIMAYPTAQKWHLRRMLKTTFLFRFAGVLDIFGFEAICASFIKNKSNQKQVLLGLQTQKNTEHHRTSEIATNQDKSYIMLYIYILYNFKRAFIKKRQRWIGRGSLVHDVWARVLDWCLAFSSLM